MNFGLCACGTVPVYGDVGGNNEEFEVYCPGCGRSVLVANKEAAPKAWDKVRLINGEQLSGLF